MCSLYFLPHADGLDLMESLFQGQLVLRTRCLECESFTERREDFQDISVPVLEDSASSPHVHSGEDVCSCTKVKSVDCVLIKTHTAGPFDTFKIGQNSGAHPHYN